MPDDAAGALPDAPLDPTAPLASTFVTRGARTFRDAARFVHALPYGRVGGWRDVLPAGRGTCSTKHALLAALAAEVGLPVTLVGGVYAMDGANTPGVGPVLAAAGLASVPEMHGVLATGDVRVDLTWPGRHDPPPPLADEHALDPDDLDQKAAIHRRAVDAWAQARGLDGAAVWAVREACIAALSGDG